MLMQKLTKRIALVTSLLVANPFLAAPLPASVLPVPEVPARASFKLELPAGLGTVERLQAGNGPTLIHIQAAHGNYGAQKKIAGLLAHLSRKYGIRTVFVEGSAFRLDRNRLRFFPAKPALDRRIADRLARDALVKGVELYLMGDARAEALGVEDLSSYVSNGRAFEEVLKARRKNSKFMRALKLRMDALAGTLLSPELRAFLKTEEAFETRRSVSFSEWLRVLRDRAAEKLEIRLEDPRFQLEWPMLVRLTKLAEWESALDRGALAQEKKAFLSVLAKSAPELARQVESRLSDSLETTAAAPETGLFYESVMQALPADWRFERAPNVRRLIAREIVRS